MSRNRIKKSIYERCLLTEVHPFETPIRFSNWGSFNYSHNEDLFTGDLAISALFTCDKYSIPYTVQTMKNLIGVRSLHLLHPNASKQVCSLYENFDTMLARACSRSEYSIRAPHKIATSFNTGKTKEERSKYIENMTEMNVYAASYFTYKNYTHIHKFFDSPEFVELERSFPKMGHIDISNFFPSIYTHSIAWAIRGKTETKRLLTVPVRRQDDSSFAASFDKLMQTVNYNETNGIPVGPEFSRLFSEIILQDIDVRVERKMSELKYINGECYRCCRYIDDYHVFFENQNVFDAFITILDHELEQYKLIINKSKTRIISRPFITNVSKRKIEISHCISSLSRKLSRYDKREEEQTAGNQAVFKSKPFKSGAIEQIRAIASEAGEDYYALTNVLLGSVYRRVESIAASSKSDSQKVRAFNEYLNVAFHWYRLDMRLNGSYKIAMICLLINEAAKTLAAPFMVKLQDKLFTEMIGAIEASCDQSRITEALNICIAAKELGSRYSVPVESLNRLAELSKRHHPTDDSEHKRLSYFEIVSLLFCSANNSDLKPIFDIALQNGKEIVEKFNPIKYAESAYLLIDLLRCPYIPQSDKIDLLKALRRHAKIKDSNYGKKKMLETISLIRQHYWYFDWNPLHSTKNLLKKKEYMLSY